MNEIFEVIFRVVAMLMILIGAGMFLHMLSSTSKGKKRESKKRGINN